MPPPRPHPAPRSYAFSLLELLVVMAIIVIAIAFGSYGFTSLGEGRSLTRGATMVEETLQLARQNARATNRRIRWSLESVADPRTGDAPGYRQIRSEAFIPEERRWKPLDAPVYLPVAIEVDPSQSTLPLPEPTIIGTNGALSLDPNQLHYLTLIHRRAPGTIIVLRIDPVSAQIQSFRP